MNCEQAETLLAAFVFGEVDPPIVNELNEHIERCETCAAALRDIRAASRLVEEALAGAPAPALTPARRRKLGGLKWPKRRKPSPLFQPIYVFGHALAARVSLRPVVTVLGGFALLVLLAGMLLPALDTARHAARSASSKNNLRQIGMAVNVWTEKRGEGESLPPSLKSLTDDGVIREENIFRNPRVATKSKPGGGFSSDYESIMDSRGGQLKESELSSDTPLAWEKKSDSGDGRNVVFFDSHVEYMPEEKFQKMMNKTKNRLARSREGRPGQPSKAEGKESAERVRGRRSPLRYAKGADAKKRATADVEAAAPATEDVARLPRTQADISGELKGRMGITGVGRGEGGKGKKRASDGTAYYRRLPSESIDKPEAEDGERYASVTKKLAETELSAPGPATPDSVPLTPGLGVVGGRVIRGGPAGKVGYIATPDATESVHVRDSKAPGEAKRATLALPSSPPLPRPAKGSAPKVVSGPQEPSDKPGGSPAGGQGRKGGGSNTGAGSPKRPSPPSARPGLDLNQNGAIGPGKDLGKAIITPDSDITPGDAAKGLAEATEKLAEDDSKGFGGFGGESETPDGGPISRLDSLRAKQFTDTEKKRWLALQRQRALRILQDADGLAKRGQHVEAARKADEVLKLDPRNKEAMALIDRSIDRQIALDTERYAKDKLSETAATWRRTRKEAIPYTDWKPLYPDDWSEKRLRVAGTQIEVDPDEIKKLGDSVRGERERKKQLERREAADLLMKAVGAKDNAPADHRAEQTLVPHSAEMAFLKKRLARLRATAERSGNISKPQMKKLRKEIDMTKRMLAYATTFPTTRGDGKDTNRPAIANAITGELIANGRALLKAGNYNEAREKLIAAEKIARQLDAINYKMGKEHDQIRNLMKQVDQAETKTRQVVRVNPFVSTKRDNKSTFALEADTGAYTLARSYLRRGKLPPKHLVRVEEFVNAFHYNYPGNVKNAFTIHTTCARSPFRDNLFQLKIGVKAKRLGRDGRRRNNIAICLDTSSSMGTPERLPLAKTALRMLVSKLDPADRVTIVTYGTRAQLVLDATPVKGNRAKIVNAINSLQSGGSTNVADGIKEAYGQANRTFRSTDNNIVVLTSDGIANVGPDDARDILAIVKNDRRQGITLTSVGVGTGQYNDRMMEQLANKGDGRYVFIDTEREAKRVFIDEFATMQVVAKDAKIQVEFEPGTVRRYRLLGYENRDIADRDFRNDAVDAGEIGSGQSATALYEIELLKPTGRIGTTRVRYKDIETGKVEEIESAIMAENVIKRSQPTPPRFRLAACAAQFAEILRGSPFADASSVKEIERTLAQIRVELPVDERVAELLAMVRAAKTMLVRR